MIKFYLSLIFLLGFTIITKAQTKALTENGKEVILFDNGTWKYSQDSTQTSVSDSADSIKVNPGKFFKTSKQTFLVKSNKLNIGIYINPAKWTFSAHRENEVNPEYRFSLKDGDGMALIITEKDQLDLSLMRNAALTNALKASLDAKIVSSEYRIVNNKKILCLQIKGTIEKIKFVYLGYYYSNENGTIQLLTYTTQKLFDTSRKELEEFLNGLVEIEK